MSFPKYNTYKNSGYECGEAFIPSHWHVRRLKTILSEPLRYGANESAESEDRNEPRFVRITDINDDGGLRDETFKSLSAELAKPFLLREGDMLFARSGATVGKSFMYSKEWGTACFAGYLIRARLNLSACLPIWLSYFCQTNSYWAYISGSQIQSTIQNVSAEKYANLYLPLPDLTEQKAIALFLDRETSKIDALVAEQRRLIELLKEKRQAVISHAVTKGLDPNVKMKPSGIEWLGDVPDHWEVKPLRRFNCRVQTGPFGSQLHADEYIFGGTPVINPTHMVDGRIIPSAEVTVTSDILERLAHQRLEPGDVIFSRRGELGRCALVTEAEAGWLCGTGSMILRLHQAEYDGGYLSLYLSMDVLRQFFESFSIGSVMNSLSSETLLSMPLIVPPAEEQRRIVRFATKQAGIIDTLQTEADRAITLLQERRTALISAAVTGKIDVRSMAKKESHS